MLDRDGPETLSSQVAAKIRGRIEAGIYPPRTRIPSINLLCTEFEVSDATVKNAIIALKDGGYVTTTPGRGTFVAPSPPHHQAGRR